MKKTSRETSAILLTKTVSQDELENQIFALLLKSLRPELKSALQSVALPHWFNKSILGILLDNEASSSLERILEGIVV